MTGAPSREVEIDPHHAALLIIDVQNYTARRDGGEYRELGAREIDERFGFFFRTMEETARPNLQRLLAACRQGSIEVLYTVIESLTRHPDRPVHRLVGSRRLRSRLSGDNRDRRLCDPQPRAPRMGAAQQPRLCAATHHRRTGRRDRTPNKITLSQLNPSPALREREGPAASAAGG
jgi:nicotinamidase-related amidase